MKQLYIFLFLCVNFISYAQTFANTNADLPNIVFSITAFGDMDNDDDLDMYLAGLSNDFVTIEGGLYIYDDGVYTLSIISGLPVLHSGSVRWGDIDNDNDLDILIQGFNASFTGESDVYLNNNDGTFTAMNLGLPPIYLGEVAFSDINNDNFLDIAFTGLETDNFDYFTKIYKNNGGNSFTELTGLTIPGFENGRIKFADYNNDTYQDFVLSGWNDNDEFSYTKIFTNNGDETFTESGISIIESSKGDTEWGDYNKDGNIDLIISGIIDDGNVLHTTLYKNNGDGTFTDINVGFEAVSHSSLEWNDFDNDGDLDILVLGSSPDGVNIYTYNIYNYEGDDTFSLSSATATISGSYNGDADSGDIDNDGRIDLVISGLNENNVSDSNVFLNTSTLGLNDFQIKTFNIFPNPSIDKKIYITYDSNITSDNNRLSIYSITGVEILNTILNKNKELDISTLKSGMYILNFISGKYSISKKLIVK